MPSGISSALGSVFSSALAPGTPKVSGILGNADAAYYGTLNPKQQGQLTKDQSRLSMLQGELSGATGGKQNHIQNAINQLNKQIATLNQTAASDKQNGYLNQFLTNLTGELPQLQQISAAQNTAANQTALQGQQQFGLPAGQAILGAQQALAPQFYQNQDKLGQFLGGQLGQGLTPQQTNFYNQQFMGNEAAMGLGSSPLGAQNAAFQLTGLNQQQANFNEQALQQYLGGYLQPSVPNIFGQQSQAGLTGASMLGGNSLQAINPSDVLNMQSNLTGLQYANKTQQANALGGALGNIAGGESALQDFSTFFGGGGKGIGGGMMGMI